MAHDLTPVVSQLVDLAARSMGGKVMFTSDDFFASKDNLISDGKAVWEPDLFGERGKIYDGWESRRNRSDQNDWVILGLAARGTISLIDIDTDHFLGNAPQFISVEGVDVKTLNKSQIEDLDWKELVPVSSVRAGRQNLFVLKKSETVSHVRLQIYPDGGVARFRCYGMAQNPSDTSNLVDYACSLNGGQAIVASDMFFGEISNLLKPNTPINMGDGWETKRRRGKGHDWVIIALGSDIIPQEIIVDTMHFKGNYPEYCSIDICPITSDLQLHKLTDDHHWKEIVQKYQLKPDMEHKISNFTVSEKIKYIRLRIYPDGGVARFKVFA